MNYTIAKLNNFLRDNLLPGWLFALRASLQGVPDAALYSPTLHPWRDAKFQSVYRKVSGHTLVSAERAWTLLTLASQALAIDGDFMEAGVFRGGTARLLRDLLAASPNGRSLHLFDTFGGMPETDSSRDLHRAHDFADTSLESVSAFVGKDAFVNYHCGLIPDTFAGLEGSRFSFAHIDVDIYKSVRDCCVFVYPRLKAGGIMVFDDYGLPSCPGARAAVDGFFADKPEVPLVLHSGQAAVIRLP